MGQCLQSKMRDAGILPAAASAPIEASVTPAAPVAPAPDAAAAVVEPELDVVPLDAAAVAANAAADAPENLIAATFGLLRAEPDGSVVIAGSGTPGSEIEVYSNGTMLGKTTVEASGDWVLVPEVRIAPGGTEITLGEVGKPGLAPQSFVVAINEDKTSEPLVVASTPGSISKVLQGLPGAAPSTQVAAADTAAPPAPAKPLAVVPPTPTPTPAPPSVETAAVTPEAPVAATAATPPVPTAAAPEPAAPVMPATTSPAVPNAPAAPPVAETAAVAPVPAPTPPSPTPTAPAQTPPAAETAIATPAPVAPAAAPAPVAPPTIDAVEVDGDKTFFAGSGAAGATVRLYVDDAFIADTTVADGRWLIEAGKVLTKADQRVRVDMLASGSAAVMSRAEVDFHIDLPAPAAPPVTTAAATPAADTAAVPTMVAVTLGTVDDPRFAAGKAIIRRGDNLWTIARRVYGEGIKYTTIYQANNGQIRNPDRIYPGQVFDLPDKLAN